MQAVKITRKDFFCRTLSIQATIPGCFTTVNRTHRLINNLTYIRSSGAGHPLTCRGKETFFTVDGAPEGFSLKNRKIGEITGRVISPI